MSDMCFEDKNVNIEICVVGSLFKKPDQYLTSGSLIKEKYDFTDDACKFFYNAFEEYYLTFSQDVTENKLNNFMSQNSERLKQYKHFGGWKMVKSFMDLADPDDFKNYFNTLKKYSLIREYINAGFPAEKILSYKNFQSVTANEVYRVMRAKADQINSIINTIDDPVVITRDNMKLVDSYLSTPQMGILTPWRAYNDNFKGLLPSKVLIQAFKSNEGKSRNLTYLIAYITLIQKKKFMMLSNEQQEKDIRNCLLTTVINGKEFQELHGVKMRKTEEELTLGLYHPDDNPNDYIRKTVDEYGEVESSESYISRIKSSQDYQNVKKVAEWMDAQLDGRFYFRDVTDDYSNERLEMEIRKAKVVFQCDAFAYDTAKASGMDDWKELKKCITQITELAKQLELTGVLTFQLSDESENVSIFDFNSTQLASSKQVRHVVDCLTMGRRLRKEEYHLCRYVPFDADDSWGEVIEQDLNEKYAYFAIKVDKNRIGRRADIILFQIDLDINEWTCLGYLVQKK
jgi:hypothetical protein